MSEVIRTYTLGDDNRGNPPGPHSDDVFEDDVVRSIRVRPAPGCPNNDPSGFVSVLRPSRPPAITKFD